MSTSSSSLSSSCPHQRLDCSDVRCIGQCGVLKWFGNLSDCTVELQYQAENENLWHSLGQYAPHTRTELGRGAIFLPQSSNIRVIDIKNKKEIVNYGRLGKGLPHLFVDSTNCTENSQIAGLSSSTSSLYSTSSSSCPPCELKTCTPLWLQLLVSLLLFAVIYMIVKR